MRTGQREEARAQLLRSTELTKNENPYLALVKLYVAEDRIIDAVAVYTEALTFVCYRDSFSLYIRGDQFARYFL